MEDGGVRRQKDRRVSVCRAHAEPDSHSSVIRKDKVVITKPRRHIPLQGGGTEEVACVCVCAGITSSVLQFSI